MYIMIRKKYSRSQLNRQKTPSFDPFSEDSLLAPDSPKLQLCNSLGFSSSFLSPQSSQLSVTTSTLSLGSSVFPDDSSKINPSYDQTEIKKPPRSNLQVNVYKSTCFYQDNGKNEAVKDTSNELINEIIDGDGFKRSLYQMRKDSIKNIRRDSRENSRKDSRRNSSEASTPHLYTDYKQRLHNILLLNVSSSSFERENDELRSISSGSLY